VRLTIVGLCRVARTWAAGPRRKSDAAYSIKWSSLTTLMKINENDQLFAYNMLTAHVSTPADSKFYLLAPVASPTEIMNVGFEHSGKCSYQGIS
jgi:hypothetical protein